MLRRRLALFALLLVTAVACTKVPLTGRKQINFIPDDEIMAMSFAQYDTVIATSSLSKDPDQVAMIKRVGTRIQGAVELYFKQNNMSDHLRGYKWEFNLIESDQANAWCMPGGKVAFYAGILPVCGDDTGVAVVMGHEVAHAVAEHGAERMSQHLLAQTGASALSVALESEPEKTQQLALVAFGVGAQYGALLPFSRTQESEADHLGLVFMAMAGYDPNAAVSFWQRMSENKGGAAPPEFMSTHPSDETRIRKIRENLPEAMGYYKK